jgi:O-antigen/teichoic acid export membrane protein
MTDPAKPQRYGKLAKKNVVWSFLREGAVSLIVFPTSMILARLLTPAEFGTAAIAYFFLALGAKLGQVGLNASLVRMKEIQPEHTSTAFVVNLGLGACLWIVLTLLAPLLAASVRSEQVIQIMPVAALTFVISAFGTVPGALMSRDLPRYRERAACEWVGTLTNSLVAVFLAWRGFGFWSIVYGHLAADLARASAKLHFARWRPSLRFSTTAFRELFSFGAGIYVKNLIEYAANNIDNLIVGRLLGMASLGFYDRAFGLTSRMVSRINLAGPSISFRIFSLIHEDHERFRRGFKQIVLAVSLVGYPIFTALILLAPALIPVLFGPRWTPSVLPFQILCAAGMLRLLTTYTVTATQAKGMIWSEVRQQAVSLVLLAVGVAALSRWGVAGAALGVLFATLVRTVLMLRLAKRLAVLRWSDVLMPQLPAVACSAGMAVVLSVARLLLSELAGNTPAWMTLTVGAIVAALFYVAFLLFSGFRDVRNLVCQTVDDLAPFAARPIRALTSGRGVAVLER